MVKGRQLSELPSGRANGNGQTMRRSRKRILAVGYVASFTAGWILAGSGTSFNVATRERKQVLNKVTEHLNVRPYEAISLSHILSQRPNWRTDYELKDWLPLWLSKQRVSEWKARRHDKKHQLALDVERELGRDDYFWKTMVDPTNFTFAIASNGFGHRLGNLAMSYLCNVVPNKRQQILFWDTPGNNYNVAWQALMDDSPVLTGAPLQWDKRQRFDYVNRHREQIGRKGQIDKTKGLSFDSDLTFCDYRDYFPSHDCGESMMCRGFDFSRETWLLRLAQEPSAQEFFMLLRAQLRKRVKDKIALFIEDKFPPDKLVIGVHVRSGNGKDDGQGDFDKKKRGDWLHDLPAAVTMVRKHARMVAFSVMDRYNYDLDFDVEGYDSAMDSELRIFLATDSAAVLDEFRRQDPNILYVEQERMKVGAGVPINEPLKCHNMTTTECLIHAEEAMLMDAMIMSSCDVALAESFSNWMYTLPATLRFAEGRIFCESGRAALGVKESDSVYAPAAWWVHPPPNTMPVRCYQGAWAARGRTNLFAVKDVS